jgi:methyl-accepting chemotaxis protein
MQNMPIISKILVVLGAFGLFAIIVAVYATSQMRAIDSAYGDLLDGTARAAVLVARGNSSFLLARVGVTEAAIAITDEENAHAKAMLSEGETSFISDMDQAASLDPAEAGTIGALKAQVLDVLDRQCAKAMAMGLASSNAASNLAAQTEYKTNCGPKFPGPRMAIKQQVDHMVAEANAAQAAIAAGTGSTILITFAAILVGLAVVMGGSVFAVRAWVAAPIKALQEVMRKLAAGDMNVRIQGAERRDEIGGMARAVVQFKQAGEEKAKLEAAAVEFQNSLDAKVRDLEASFAAASRDQKIVVDSLAAALAGLSANDLTMRLTENVASAYEALKTDFNRALENLQGTMVAIASNTQGVRAGAGEITAASDDLARRTEHQAATLEQTAAALDEITVTVRKTAENASEAKDAVTAAKNDAQASETVVTQTVAAMNAIEASSKQISNIIGVIDEIAFQTNLLALNAGVEAARAGDAGRGFAVVATEVRALAQRSADAAKEIKALISASGVQVESGVKLVGETGRSLTRIAEQVERLNGLVTGIAASAQEQATGLAEVNKAMNQMDQTTQQNAAMVEESTAASHSLESEADELARLVGQFQLGQVAAAAPPPRPAAIPAVAKPSAPVLPKPKSRIPVHAPMPPPKIFAEPSGKEDWDEF